MSVGYGCVDSFTALTAVAVGFQLGIKAREGKGKKLSSGIQVPSWDEFNREASVVQQILDIAKILPCNMIFTAHPVDKSIDTGGTLKKGEASLHTGQNPSLVPIYFNEIYQFGIEPPSAPDQPAQRFILTNRLVKIWQRQPCLYLQELILREAAVPNSEGALCQANLKLEAKAEERSKVVAEPVPATIK
jgi:hypothetical protein